jgi:hypothetical protein
LMRYAIASKVPTHQRRLMEFVRDHEDAYVRCGYYASNNFIDAADVEKAFAIDGRAFIDAAVRNEALYHRNSGAAMAFAAVVSRRTQDDHLAWEFAQNDSAIHRHMAEKLFANDPETFYSPDELSKSDEVRSLNEKVLAEEPTERSVMWMNRRLGMVEHLKSSDGSERTGRLVLISTQVLAAAVSQMGRQLVHLARRVTQSKAESPVVKARARTDLWPVAILVLGGVLVGYWLGR